MKNRVQRWWSERKVLRIQCGRVNIFLWERGINQVMAAKERKKQLIQVWEDKSKKLQSSLSRFRWACVSKLVKISVCQPMIEISVTSYAISLQLAHIYLLRRKWNFSYWFRFFASEEFTRKNLDVRDTESAWNLIIKKFGCNTRCHWLKERVVVHLKNTRLEQFVFYPVMWKN